jgi:ABC-type Mn2+/Zn2+ transport system ATPase subunit
MFREPGLYLMDEPEAALSFTSCLQLVALIQKLGQSGAQVVCATHWDKLELVDHWRRYLHDPNSYLRHVTDS